MIERRFQPGFREEPTDEPGLVIGDDGAVYVVSSNGTRTRLSGGSPVLAIVFLDTAQVDAVAPEAPIMYPVLFDTVRFDPDGLWNQATYQFDVAADGWYECGVYLEQGGGQIVADQCVPGGTIIVGGPGNNIDQTSYTPTNDPAAFSLPVWNGITHLVAGNTVELHLVTGSPTGTEEDHSRLIVSRLAFYISMLYPG